MEKYSIVLANSRGYCVNSAGVLQKPKNTIAPRPSHHCEVNVCGRHSNPDSAHLQSVAGTGIDYPVNRSMTSVGARDKVRAAGLIIDDVPCAPV